MIIPLSSKFPEFIESTLKTLKYVTHFYIRVDALSTSAFEMFKRKKWAQRLYSLRPVQTYIGSYNTSDSHKVCRYSTFPSSMSPKLWEVPAGFTVGRENDLGEERMKLGSAQFW